jgi:hypothetical protein
MGFVHRLFGNKAAAPGSELTSTPDPAPAPNPTSTPEPTPASEPQLTYVHRDAAGIAVRMSYSPVEVVESHGVRLMSCRTQYGTLAGGWALRKLLKQFYGHLSCVG